MKSILGTSAVFAAVLACGTANAAFDGQSFNASYRVPSIDTPYPDATATPSSFVVGSGVETTVNVENVTSIAVDFSDTSLDLLLTTSLSDPTWGTAPFNGLVFDLASPGTLGITGVTIDGLTSMSGFDASHVTVTGNRIAIDWNGLSYENGTRVVVDFDFASAVPEPATYALMFAGLGLVGFSVRRKAS
jgi:PEP-CTERM motif